MQPYIKVSFIYIQFPVEMPTGKNNPMWTVMQKKKKTTTTTTWQ